MAIGFEFEDGLVEEGGGSPVPGAVPAAAFWRRADECPFTVLAGADVLPAGELPDMGRTLGKSVTAGVIVRGTMIRWEWLLEGWKAVVAGAR